MQQPANLAYARCLSFTMLGFCIQGLKFDPQTGAVLHIELARANSRTKRSRSGLWLPRRISVRVTLFCVQLHTKVPRHIESRIPKSFIRRN